MDHQRTMAFRREAMEEGLGGGSAITTSARFFLDLNQGPLYAPADVEKIARLVELARKHAVEESYGEHGALLELVARREELDGAVVMWHRSYHVNRGRVPDGWVSLRDWLAENGHAYSPS
jgi:hypothetical protein